MLNLVNKLPVDGLRQNKPLSQPQYGIETKRNWPKVRMAQVSLELIGSLIVCLVLIVGIARVFVWLNQCLINRQNEYQNTRVAPRENIDNFYAPEDLSILSR